MSELSPDTTIVAATSIVAPPRRPGGARPDWSHRAIFWSFLDQAILSGFSFIIGIGTGRLVGIAEFGKFAIVMIFVTLASVVYEALFTTPLMTLAGHRRRSRSYYGAVVVAGGVGAVGLGISAALLFAGYSILSSGSLALGLAAATGALIATQGIQLVLRRILFARQKGRLATTMDFGRYALFVAGMGALVMAGGRIDVQTVLWGLALSGLITAAISVSTTGAVGARLRSRIVLVAASQHWQIARWLVAVALVSFGQDQLLWILAAPVLGDAAIGGLRATLYLFGPILLLMGAIENILPVRAAAALADEGLVGLKTYLVRFAIPFGAANVALILFAVLPGATWLAWLFGPAYVDYVPVLEIMGVTTAFSLVRNYLVHYFRAVRSTNAIFYSFFCGLVLSIVLVYPLVHWFGVVGLAIGTVVSQFASMLYLIVAASRHYLGHRQAIDTRRVVQV